MFFLRSKLLPVFCIKDLLNIIKSIVIICAYVTTIYGGMSKNLDGQILASDLSDPAIIVHWGNTGLKHSIQARPTYYCSITPEENINLSSHDERCLPSTKFFTLNIYLYSSWTESTSGTHIYNPWLNILEKWLDSSDLPEITLLTLLLSLFIRLRSDQKFNGVLLPILDSIYLILTFQTWQNSKAYMWVCERLTILHPPISSYRRNITRSSLIYRYIAI